jgi:large subunit ribosomal protein L25
LIEEQEMETAKLSVELRSGTGKSVTRKLRAAGRLPGVLYGLGKSAPVTVDPATIQRILLNEKERLKVFFAEGNGITGKNVIVKDYQVDPLSRKLVHVDLLEVDITKTIDVVVPINIVGKAAGVTEGGVLNIIEREILVRCLPTKVPNHIDVDVTSLTIGSSIHLDEIALPEGVQKVSTINETIVTCVPPTKEEEAVASLAPTAEPEVLTAKQPAAGEAGADAKKDDKK